MFELLTDGLCFSRHETHADAQTQLNENVANNDARIAKLENEIENIRDDSASYTIVERS